MKTLMNSFQRIRWTTLWHLVALAAVVLWVQFPAPAQELPLDEQIPLVTNPPPVGTFYLIQNRQGPPYPFDPSYGQLSVYLWKPGVYLVDDSQVDYFALSSGGGGMSLMSGPGPCDPCSTNGLVGGTNEPPYSGPPAYSFASNQLWLEITKVTNNQAFFVIHTPETNATYDLFSTTNLTTNFAGLNRTNWVWLFQTAAGQTNFSLTNLWMPDGWFQLGTMLDTDGDGLTDAYEILASHTKPSGTNSWDTDGDGAGDFDEWLIGRNPLVPGAASDSGGTLRLRMHTRLK